MNKHTFEPKIISVLREGYSLPSLGKDLLAGLIVGIVALPLSIAIAIASGAKPEQGLITAFVAGLLISLLSGSRVQIGGPTGAFIIIVFGISQKYGYDGLAAATVMAGILLVIMGFMRMGDVIKYIPYPVTVGFTSGIALVIFTTQIPDFFGVHLISTPAHFAAKWITYGQNYTNTSPYALILGLLTILIIRLWPRFDKRLPGTLIAILVTTGLVIWLKLPVETIASRFGEVPNRFPAPHLPHITIDMIIQLASPAITIALLAGIESLLSAVVADGMLGTKHRSNMELVAQGVANIVSPIFSGIPATGAIARTATNIKNGGRTPFAGIVHAFVILMLFLFCGKWAGLIPMPCLAGILIVVAYNMSEWRHFKRLLRSPQSDVLVLLLTFGLTVLVDLTVAIEVGVVLAALLFMHRMAESTHIDIIHDNDQNGRPHEYAGVPEGVEIFEINGPFFFGAVDKFREALLSFKKLPKILILRMSAVPAVDASAVSSMERLIKEAKRDGTHIIIAGVSHKVFKTFHKSGLVERIGLENILSDVSLALAHAIVILENDETAGRKS
ncbi:MAG: STAS domain-containing protein [Candidatus Omnitrophica bacterium]|nr:STAS domain-containing protein [Candidatus Omnitrophota bacterium]